MMNWSAISHYLSANWLEIAGFVTTLAGISLTTKRLLICWPVVLISDMLYLIVFYRARLYSDALLQIFFVAFTLYGWWHWWRGARKEGEVRVVALGLRGWMIGLVAGAIGSLLLGLLMTRIGAALPMLDATLASYSLVGSWWQARRHTANWWLWIVINFVYVGEYVYKGLVLTGLLYLLLVGLAVLGLLSWRRAEGATPQTAA